MKKSNFLTVTEDETKIFRTVPVAPIINADDCTIYVVSNTCIIFLTNETNIKYYLNACINL